MTTHTSAAPATAAAAPAAHTAAFFLDKQARDSWSNHFRRKRLDQVAELIRAIAAREGRCRIVDIGGREEYWTPILPVLDAVDAHVTVVNLEQTTPQPGHRFSFARGNACDLSAYGDRAFDLAHSNSLIEHVGGWEQMVACAREISRVAPCYHVQTPYLWFPVEPHFRVPFFAWLPEQSRARLLLWRDLGYFSRAATLDQAMRDVSSIRLLDLAQMRALFPEATIGFERVLGLPKSMIATRDSRPA